MAMVREKWSISSLAVEFDMDRRTVGRKLSQAGVTPCDRDGRKQMYWMLDAAPALIPPRTLSPDEEEQYILEQEKARLTHHQANKAAMEEERLRGDLHKAEDVKAVMADMIAATRARLLNLPPKAAPLCLGRDLAEIEATLSDLIRDTLLDLSELKAEVVIGSEDADAGE